MNKKIMIPLLSLAFLIGGAGMGMVGIASAQSASTSTSPGGTSGSPKMHGHAPLGNDGNITAINGSTITMTEEADEGGAAYAVDASAATITKAGAIATLSDLKIGDKIFVKGTVSGTNVAATSISDGPMHRGMGMFGHRGMKNHARATPPTATVSQ